MIAELFNYLQYVQLSLWMWVSRSWMWLWKLHILSWRELFSALLLAGFQHLAGKRDLTKRDEVTWNQFDLPQSGMALKCICPKKNVFVQKENVFVQNEKCFCWPKMIATDLPELNIESFHETPHGKLGSWIWNPGEKNVFSLNVETFVLGILNYPRLFLFVDYM